MEEPDHLYVGYPATKRLEQKRSKDQQAVRHTVKVAILKGDEVYKDLLAISIYDTKPAYFLTSVASEIKWIEKKRFLIRIQKNISLTFLQIECH